VLQQLSLVNCFTDNSGGSNSDSGGAISLNEDSTVSLSQVRLVNHTTSNGAGGGGAIFVDGDKAWLTVDLCTFQNNFAHSGGGAIYVTGSSDTLVHITNSEFISNSVGHEGNGGAIYCSGNTTTEASNSLFESNNAESGLGGAIFANQKSRFISRNNEYKLNVGSYGGAQEFEDESVVQHTNDLYRKNIASNNGGAAQAGGKATVTWTKTRFTGNSAAGSKDLILRSSSNITIESCSFEGTGVYDNNEAQVGGVAGNIVVRKTTFSSGFSGFGGGLTIGGTITDFLMEDSVFVDNNAFDRGAFSIIGLSLNDFDTKTNLVIKRTRFENNRAISTGGAIGGSGVNHNFVVRFQDCEFVDNTASVTGGAGYFETSGVFSFDNCTFKSNVAQKGGVFGLSGSVIVMVKDCKFDSNNGDYGGVFFSTSSGKYQVKSSSFIRNQVDFDGGVYYSDTLSDSCPEFKDSNFDKNTALGSGGCFFFDLDVGSTHRCKKVSSFCDGCAFSDNEASEGYGDDYATSPIRLIPYDALPTKLYPSQTFNTSLLVIDGFDQPLLGFIGEFRHSWLLTPY